MFPLNENSDLKPVRGGGPRLRSAVMVALVAGPVGTSSTVALFIFMIYCKTHQVDRRKESSKGSHKKKGSTLPAGSTCELRDCGLSAPASQNKAMSSSISRRSRIQDPSKSPNSFKVSSPNKMNGSLHLFDSALKFSAEDLSCAPAEAIRTSCHGTLYKAVLESGHVLAVKWLKEGILKNRKDFPREVNKLGNVGYPNLVLIMGYY